MRQNTFTRMLLALSVCAALAVMIMAWDPVIPRVPVEDGGRIAINDNVDGRQQVKQLTRRISDGTDEGSESTISVAVRSGANEIEGASLLGVCSVGEEARAVTDRGGRAELSFSGHQATDFIIQAYADGYAPKVVQARGQPHVDIDLDKVMGQIRGSVQVSRGVPLSGLEVVAWPSGLTGVGAFLARGGGVRARIGAGGRFVINGLTIGLIYNVAVSGRGWTSERIEKARCVEGEPADVQLVACKVYGVIVRCISSSGANPAYSDFAEVVYSYRIKNGRSINTMIDWALAHLWHEAASKDVRKDWREWLLGYKGAPRDQRSIVDVSFSTPGYEEAFSNIPVFPISTHIPIRTVSLTETRDRLADVSIRFTQECGHWQTALRKNALFVLQFKRLDGASTDAWREPYLQLHSGVLRGLEEGSYEAALARSASEIWYPEEGREIQIRKGGDNAVTFETSNLASMRIHLGDDGEEKRRVVVTVESGGRSYRYPFNAQPYHLWGVPSGVVEVRVEGYLDQEVILAPRESKVVKMEEG